MYILSHTRVDHNVSEDKTTFPTEEIPANSDEEATEIARQRREELIASAEENVRLMNFYLRFEINRPVAEWSETQ